jgi:hypothetical protein
MWESLSHISSLTIFLGIAALGFLFVLISFVFGELFEAFDFHHDFAFDDGPGVFSARVLSVFATAFGGFGAIGVYQGSSVFVSSVFGLSGGLAFGAVVYFFARFLYQQQSSSVVNAAELIGLTAQVSVGIPSEGIGQICCLVGESRIEKIARSKDGSAIALNAQVIIEAVQEESVIVSPYSEADRVGGLFPQTIE